MGGAYVALGEDTSGAAVNSAAPAVRTPYSVDWFDHDIGLGASFPGAFARTDFDNRGDFAAVPHARAGDFIHFNFGLTLQFGALGVAGTGDIQQYTLSSPDGDPRKSGTMRLGRWKALAAHGFFDGQVVVGAGARIPTMQILDAAGDLLLTMTGAAPEAGVLVMPTGRAFRVGASLRTPVSATVFGGGRPDAAGVVLPGQVVMPWEAELGFAYQVGPRPLNPGWQSPLDQDGRLRSRIESAREARARTYEAELGVTQPAEREARRLQQQAEERSLRAIEDERLAAEDDRLRAARAARYLNWPRERILLLASLLVTGPTDDAVSVEGFLDQRVETVGRSATFTPRLGMEGEPIPERMRLRVGTYVEPSRYADGTARQHFTFGSDVKLFPLTFWGLLPGEPWEIAFFADLAPRYVNAGIGIGYWR